MPMLTVGGSRTVGRARHGAPATGGSFAFESDWSTATGTDYGTAVSDGGAWDNQLTCGRTDTMAVVVASGVDADWTRSTNLLRVTFGSTDTACGAIERLDAVALSTSHYGRLFYRRVDQTYGASLHNFSYNFLGTIQEVFFNPVVQPLFADGVAADGWCFNHGSSGGTYPYNGWRCQRASGSDPFAVPYAKFAYDAWYLYEWYIEYLTATTYRLYPRISSYNAVTNTATLLYDADDMYPTDQPNGTTLSAWYGLGNYMTVRTDAELMRNIGIGNEGRTGQPTNATRDYIADFAVGTGDWLGVTAQ